MLETHYKMEDFDEQAEQTKDIPYLDGFNIGYQLQKKTEDKFA